MFFKKVKRGNRRKIYFCGIQIFTYKRKKNASFMMSSDYVFHAASKRKAPPINKVDFKQIFPTFRDVPHIVQFKDEASPDVSIVIPVYNNYQYTKQCLASIERNVKGVSYEIIIADDGSTDETVNIAEMSHIKYIINKGDKGFLANCNNAAKSAVGKYIAFLNNDTQVFENWLESLVHTIENDQSVGLVGSKLIYPDNTLQEAGGIVYNDASGCNYGRNCDPSLICFNYMREVNYISGASILMRRDLFEEFGGFDTLYSPAYYEDTDLAMRVRYEKNLKVIYQPLSVVLHYEGKSNGTDLSSGLKQYQVLNKEKFFQKWKTQLEANHYRSDDDIELARNAVKSKKIVLVIDWKILTYSKDTGSRTTYQYLHFFKNCGYSVKFYAHEWNAVEDFSFLQDHLNDGFDVIAEPFDTFIKRFGKHIDFVYLNRPNIAPAYIDLIREHTNAKVFYQCHDLHHLRQYRQRLVNKDPLAEKILAVEKKYEYDVFRKMDVVCSFSDVEVRMIQEEDSSIVAQQIPLFMLDCNNMPKVEYIPQERTKIIFVASFAHPPNIDAFLWFVEDIFPKIKEQIPEVQFYAVGEKPAEAVVAKQSEDIIVTGTVSEEELKRIYTEAKIVVGPLRFGAGVKGKVLEALYNKVPVITTSMGVEGIPNDSKLINVADTAEDFANQVVELYRNDALLSEKSASVVPFIQAHYTFDAAKKCFEQYIGSEQNFKD